ncbi:unnamed protein product, partial [Ilex paraguariensis]
MTGSGALETSNAVRELSGKSVNLSSVERSLPLTLVLILVVATLDKGMTRVDSQGSQRIKRV